MPDPQLDLPARKRLLGKSASLGIAALHREYHANVYDGTQWDFVIVQGGRRKSIDCDNFFPVALQEFAKALDKEIDDATMKWTVPTGDARWEREAEIWK